MKVAVLEDEFFVSQQLKKLIEKNGCSVVHVFHSAEDLMASDLDFDLAFLDIFLEGELTGLDAGRFLKEHRIPFVFLTANQDTKTLKEAAVLEPITYVTKPFKPLDIVVAIELTKNYMSPSITLNSSIGKKTIKTKNILYLKGSGSYVDIFTIKGKITQRKLLKDLQDQLPTNFIRVHKSYVVNKDWVDECSNNLLIIAGNEVPITKNQEVFA